MYFVYKRLNFFWGGEFTHTEAACHCLCLFQSQTTFTSQLLFFLNEPDVSNWTVWTLTGLHSKSFTTCLRLTCEVQSFGFWTR